MDPDSPSRDALIGFREGQSGAVLVFTMIAITVLLAMSALVIDLGFGYVVDRRAATAADHASLAAAYASCDGANVNAAATSAVVNNGFQPGELNLSQTAPDTYRAVVTTQINTYFGSVIGFDEMTVSAEALATCSVAVSSGGGYTIFAGGNSCGSYGKDEIDISGSNQEVWGGVHSNGRIKVGGSSNDFGPGDPAVDPFTYVTTIDLSGSGNQFDAGYPDQVPFVGTWPVEFVGEDYKTLAKNGNPNHHFKNGDIDADYIIARGDGLYYATGKITLDQTMAMSLTLVAQDVIDMSGSDQTLTPYMDDLLAFGAANYSGSERCDKQGVKIAGSNNDWSGIIYADKSQVEISGSNNTTIHGSIVAWSVKLNGSGITLEADDSGGGGGGNPVVSLLE